MQYKMKKRLFILRPDRLNRNRRNFLFRIRHTQRAAVLYTSVLLFMIFGGNVPALSQPRLNTPGMKWQLVWKDDFKGSSIDTSLWDVFSRNKGWGSEKYRTEQVTLSKSICIFTAVKEGDNYWSGGLTNKGKKGVISHGYYARPDLCNVNNVQDPKDYVGRFWVDSITHNADALRFLLSLIGPEKIAYGTDYPFPLGDLEHGKFIQDMTDISPLIKDQLFAGTVLDFLGLQAKDYEPWPSSMDPGVVVE